MLFGADGQAVDPAVAAGQGDVVAVPDWRVRRCCDGVPWRGTLRWKIALGLPVDHEGWHPTSLTKFRARLLLHELERVALERTLALAEELGMLEGPVEQIIDSTPMLGAAATQDTVRLVRHGVRKLLDAVAAVDEAAAEPARSGAGVRLRQASREAGLSVAGEGRTRTDADPCRRGRRTGASGRRARRRAARRRGGRRGAQAAA